MNGLPQAAFTGGRYGAENAATPARAPEIPRYADELSKAADSLHQALSNLDSRLTGVSRSSPPATVGGSSPTEVPSSAHGAQMQTVLGLMWQAESRIRDMTDRLEV